MRASAVACLLLVLVCLLPVSTVVRADYRSSSSWFNSMPEDERALLQSRLILTGHYFALADSEFGPRTYNAITDFQKQVNEPRTGVLSKRAQLALNSAAAAIFSDLGMDVTEDPRGRITLIVPHTLLPKQTNTTRGTAFDSADGSIRLETIRKPQSEQTFRDLYLALRRTSSTRSVTYAVYDQDRFIVSGKAGSRLFYMLFRNTGRDSVGYAVEWEEAENARGSMVATFLASYSYPSEFDDPLTTDDYETGAGVADRAEPATEPPSTTIGTASGFFISKEGLIVTNRHVVDRCETITVPGFGAVRLVTSDEDLDLAILRTKSRKPKSWAQVRYSDVELGEDVILLGYPLSSLLNSSLSVGTGIVSSETGIGGEPSWFTTNVGVQPGNSGGPIVDRFGRVVGVAVAKLDDSVMMAESGNVAPNFGFAIKNTALREFLSIFRTSNNARIQNLVGKDVAPSVSEIVDIAREYTVQVICRND